MNLKTLKFMKKTIPQPFKTVTADNNGWREVRNTARQISYSRAGQDVQSGACWKQVKPSGGEST